jgi:hypothetical protein
VEWGIQKASNQKIRSSLPDFEEDLPVKIDTTCPASVIHGDVTFEPGCWKLRVEESVHDVQAGKFEAFAVRLDYALHTWRGFRGGPLA